MWWPAQLAFDGPSGYLRSTLTMLGVPVESQIALFVPDSLQRARITPSNPRTIFFNDSVAVAWVRGGFIELAAQDPTQGIIFYTLDATPRDVPQFARRGECLSCHYSYSTAGIPGMLVRSAGQFAVDHRVPVEQRWGGWYCPITFVEGPPARRGFLQPAPVDPKGPMEPVSFGTAC